MDSIERLLLALYRAARTRSETEFLQVARCLLEPNAQGDRELDREDAVTHGVLTKAERAAAEQVAGGLSYKEAAVRLHVSPATVRNQLHSVYQKLRVNNKACLGRILEATQPH